MVNNGLRLKNLCGSKGQNFQRDQEQYNQQQYGNCRKATGPHLRHVHHLPYGGIETDNG